MSNTRPWDLKYPVILKLEGKYADNHYICNNTTELALALHEIFRLHEHAGYYHPDLMHVNERKHYFEIRDCEDLEDVGMKPIWSFMFGRADYEYEKISVIIPDKY